MSSDKSFHLFSSIARSIVAVYRENREFKWGLEGINKIRGLTKRGEGGGGEEAVCMPEVGLTASLGLEKGAGACSLSTRTLTTLFCLAKVKRFYYQGLIISPAFSGAVSVESPVGAGRLWE